MIGLAAYVDWKRRPLPPRPCWETDPWREGAPVEEIAQYEEAEAARLAVTVDPQTDGVDHELAVEGLYGHRRETSPARSQSYAVAKELSERYSWDRVWVRRPLSAAARELERRSHKTTLTCHAQRCKICDFDKDTTPDAGTSRAENASDMKP